LYEKILKPIFFLFDAEHVHDFFKWFGECLGRFSLTRWAVRKCCDYEHPALESRVAGLNFKNPVGLAGGFDKDVRLTQIIPAVGFGFMEVGAVTRYPFGGNQGMHVARLPKDQAIIVYYGLKNIGAEAIEKKLHRLTFAIPVGLNIAKTNREDIKGEKSVEDYAATFRMLAKYFAYVTVNISCPNAQDGRLFQEPQLLDRLLAALSKEKKEGPVFLKISTDLTNEEADKIIATCEKYPFIDGFIVGNLTKRREILSLKSSPEELNRIPKGGISGKPIRSFSTNLIRHIYKQTQGKYTIIGLGGVFSAEDAYEKIKAGASAVQMVTGMIYKGPMVIKRINKGLVQLLERDGYSHISEAIGKEAQ